MLFDNFYYEYFQEQVSFHHPVLEPNPSSRKTIKALIGWQFLLRNQPILLIRRKQHKE
ncbi:hypothetical protein NIES4072_48540 [Nostoc commune NIES-4072]|uniref:Uncharacterized protein n=1 Tax=Nostoc commune NIES-4072 TaxID=2005467 RepID=A0A2R5FZ97_NOSCO|nr:hypothetical protein NIES4072_48540 [Nostoc commune NIES-4072]